MTRRTLVFAALAAAMLLAGCAVNPATGKRQFMLVSEQQEMAMGRENDTVLVEQMGLYPDDPLQEYVQSLGRRMAERSERPDLDWTFRVVDDPIVNAFALPGGYIYITRGILAHMNSEAELASVVGHEIGHVTARHSASQMSKSQLFSLGLGATGVLAPEHMSQYGALAQAGLGLLFLKYGRDDERQADDLGLRYLVRTGYDARLMPGVYEMLGAVAAAQGAGRIPSLLSTHPSPENRSGRIRDAIAAIDPRPDFDASRVGRVDYLTWLDGLVYGDDPREGFFEGNRFHHPELAFRMELPDGWSVRNLKQAVVAITEEQDAMIQLTLSSEGTADAALRQFFSQEGVLRTGPAMGSISGLPTSGDGFTVATEQGALQGRVGFVEYGGRVYRLMGYCAQPSWPGYERAIRSSLASFDRLTDRRYLDVEPKHLRVVRVDREMTLEEFGRRHDATVTVDKLALLNRVEPGARLEPGRDYKVVVGGQLP